jgi:hypothetical protein
MNNALIPFRFQGVKLKEACWLEGKPYFTRKAIGEWLEYVKPRPDVAIAKIVDRNPHIRQFATVTKLVTVEGGREVSRDLEVYDPIGLQLIINKSNQPKALAFQIAVAHMVLAYMKGELVPLTCFEGLEGIMGIPRSKGINKAVERLAEERGCTKQTIYRQLGRLKAGEPVYKEKQDEKSNIH